MCRRCGEPDRRGSNKSRRARKLRLIRVYGDEAKGTIGCIWCDKVLNYKTLTVDRLVPGCEGGTYRWENIAPACRHCNIVRYFTAHEFPDGCEYGPAVPPELEEISA